MRAGLVKRPARGDWSDYQLGIRSGIDMRADQAMPRCLILIATEQSARCVV